MQKKRGILRSIASILFYPIRGMFSVPYDAGKEIFRGESFNRIPSTEDLKLAKDFLSRKTAPYDNTLAVAVIRVGGVTMIISGIVLGAILGFKGFTAIWIAAALSFFGLMMVLASERARRQRIEYFREKGKL